MQQDAKGDGRPANKPSRNTSAGDHRWAGILFANLTARGT